MFVKFDCGCIGTVPDENKQTVMVDYCAKDHSDNDLSFHKSSSCEDKTYVPLSFYEIDSLITRIGELVRDGYKFRTIKSLLKSN